MSGLAGCRRYSCETPCHVKRFLLLQNEEAARASLCASALIHRNVSGWPYHPNRISIYGKAAFSGNNSSIRLLGQAGNFSSVSFGQA
jgi:hypothetical protein